MIKQTCHPSVTLQIIISFCSIPFSRQSVNVYVLTLQHSLLLYLGGPWVRYLHHLPSPLFFSRGTSILLAPPSGWMIGKKFVRDEMVELNFSYKFLWGVLIEVIYMFLQPVIICNSPSLFKCVFAVASLCSVFFYKQQHCHSSFTVSPCRFRQQASYLLCPSLPPSASSTLYKCLVTFINCYSVSHVLTAFPPFSLAEQVSFKTYFVFDFKHVPLAGSDILSET